MKKNVFGRGFKRDRNERKALFKGLISSLILDGRIKTTEEKAKAIRGDVDKIITSAKKGETARRLLQASLRIDAVEKVISKVAPRFNKRQGGYTRIIKLGRRFSDNAAMVLMEWVEGSEVENSRLKVQSLDKTESKNKEDTKKEPKK